MWNRQDSEWLTDRTTSDFGLSPGGAFLEIESSPDHRPSEFDYPRSEPPLDKVSPWPIQPARSSGLAS